MRKSPIPTVATPSIKKLSTDVSKQEIPKSQNATKALLSTIVALKQCHDATLKCHSQPAPPFKPVYVIKLKNGDRQQIAESRTELRARIEDSSAKGHLSLGIPAGEEEQGCWEEDSLHDPQEEAAHEETDEVVDRGSEC